MAKWQSKLVAYGNWGIKDSYQDMPSETKRVGNGKKREERERLGKAPMMPAFSHTHCKARGWKELAASLGNLLPWQQQPRTLRL